MEIFFAIVNGVDVKVMKTSARERNGWIFFDVPNGGECCLRQPDFKSRANCFPMADGSYLSAGLTRTDALRFLQMRYAGVIGAYERSLRALEEKVASDREVINRAKATLEKLKTTADEFSVA